MPIIPTDNLGSVGVIRDVAPHELGSPAWSRSSNIRYRNGYAEKFLGHAGIFGTPTVTPIYLQPLSTATGRFWVYASTAKLYSVTGTTHTNITRQTATVDVDYNATSGSWSGGVLGGIAIINNPNDAPQFWNGTGKAADLTNWPANTRCKVIRPFKNFLIAAGITKAGTAYPHMVKWSNPAVPGSVPNSWDETNPANDAGEFDLADDQTRIVDALGLGDQFIVYKEGAFYAMQYIGAGAIFRQQKLVSGQIGALSLNCAVEFPGGHAVIGQGDIVYHAGGNPQSIVDQRMRSWFFNNLDAQNYTASFTTHNFLRSEVWFCFPQVGATTCNTALIWNYKDNTLSIRDLPNVSYATTGVTDYVVSNSWDSAIGAWDDQSTKWNQSEFTQAAQRLIMASASNNKIYQADYTESFDGTSFTAYIEREGLDFGDPMSIKTMTQVRPIIDAKPGQVIQVTTGGAMDLQAGTKWNTPVNFTVGTNQKVDTFATGRYLAIRFTSTNASPWRLKRYDMTIETVSAY